MSSDRGTIPRGSRSETDQSSWGEPTAPGGRRLPSAPRERKPALAALAVLLIIGGAAAAGLLVIKTGQRVSAIEITQTVGQGQQIPRSAMTEVQVPSDGSVQYVNSSFENQVSQDFAATTIVPGTILNRNMVAKSNELSTGRNEVTLALKDGQMPQGLTTGATVNIYSTQTSTTGCPGAPGASLAQGATVVQIAANTSGSGTTDVEVALNPQSIGSVVCNAANGTAGVAIAPNSTG